MAEVTEIALPSGGPVAKLYYDYDDPGSETHEREAICSETREPQNVIGLSGVPGLLVEPHRPVEAFRSGVE